MLCLLKLVSLVPSLPSNDFYWISIGFKLGRRPGIVTGRFLEKGGEPQGWVEWCDGKI